MHMPKLLQTLAATAWGAAIMGVFTGYDGDLRHYSALDARICFCCIGLAITTSSAALAATHFTASRAEVADRVDRTYIAMHQAAVSRPRDAGPPSVPFPAVPRLDSYRQQRAKTASQ